MHQSPVKGDVLQDAARLENAVLDGKNAKSVLGLVSLTQRRAVFRPRPCMAFLIVKLSVLAASANSALG